MTLVRRNGVCKVLVFLFLLIAHIAPSYHYQFYETLTNKGSSPTIGINLRLDDQRNKSSTILRTAKTLDYIQDSSEKEADTTTYLNGSKSSIKDLKTGSVDSELNVNKVEISDKTPNNRNVGGLNKEQERHNTYPEENNVGIIGNDKPYNNGGIFSRKRLTTRIKKRALINPHVIDTLRYKSKDLAAVQKENQHFRVSPTDIKHQIDVTGIYNDISSVPTRSAIQSNVLDRPLPFVKPVFTLPVIPKPTKGLEKTEFPALPYLKKGFYSNNYKHRRRHRHNFKRRLVFKNHYLHGKKLEHWVKAADRRQRAKTAHHVLADHFRSSGHLKTVHIYKNNETHDIAEESITGNGRVNSTNNKLGYNYRTWAHNFPLHGTQSDDGVDNVNKKPVNVGANGMSVLPAHNVNTLYSSSSKLYIHAGGDTKSKSQWFLTNDSSSSSSSSSSSPSSLSSSSFNSSSASLFPLYSSQLFNVVPQSDLTNSGVGNNPRKLLIPHTSRKMPQALIIGVKKGGTRAVLEFLRLHPDVRAPGPEPHFFDRHYHNGLEWYRSLMPRSEEGQLTIEKTPSYFITKDVPRRVYQFSKHLKLIVVVRDPVTRAISDYTQVASKKMDSRSFEEMVFVDNTSRIVDTQWSPVRIGVYAKHLKHWLQYFPLEQMHFVSGERLIENPADEMLKVQQFLGLRPVINHRHFYLKSRKGFPCILKPNRQKGSHPHCLGETKGRIHPMIDPSVIRRLRDFYKPFNIKFYRMVNQDFGWV